MTQLFDTEGFVPRTQCGPAWSEPLVLVHTLSDVTIFICYLLIPFGMLALFMQARRGQKPVHSTLGMFLTMGFILTCGLTHLTSRAMFTWPAYRLDGAVKLACALFSMATVFWMMSESYQSQRRLLDGDRS